jgi:ribosome-associated translation inhibitor RaiA
MPLTTLKIEVSGADFPISDALRRDVERCVLLALSRFGPRLRKVTLSLAEPVNPLGGVDQRCRMRASLDDGDDVQVEAINGTTRTAVARAAAQLANRLDSARDRVAIH